MSTPLKTALRGLCGDRGLALISVLWILVLLTAIVGQFAYSMRTEVNITRNFKEATQAYYIAHSGLMRSVVEILRNTAARKNPESVVEAAEDTVWRVNVPIPPQRFGAGEFIVNIDNTAGLIDINTANEKLLRLLIQTLDISDREKSVIVDSILDWRDSDDFHRLNGAEDNHYQSLAAPYACKNALFDTVEELLLVRGMTPELFRKNLKPLITIIPQSTANPSGKGRSSPAGAGTNPGQININAAPRQLLEALPQMTAQQVESLIDYRADRDFRSLPEVRDLIGAETFAAISPYITLTLSPYYTIRAEGRISGSSVRQIIRAMVEINDTPDANYQVVSWQDQYY